jgi:hypothetical protein
MWILTRSDWPMLVNLSVVATIGYQQVAKFETRIRVVAAAWEAEHLLADCASADEAKALVRFLAQALRQGTGYVDLNQLDLSRLGPAEATEQDVL